MPVDLVARARSLASDAGLPLSRVISEALDQYLHLRGLADLLDELNAEYGPLPPDPPARHDGMPSWIRIGFGEADLSDRRLWSDQGAGAG